MANYDPTMVRRILLSLFKEDGGQLRERLRLSPPESGNDSDEMLRHIDRMEEVGLVRRTREIHMKPPPDPVTLRPTSEAALWARIARDDEQWERKEKDLLNLLESGP